MYKTVCKITGSAFYARQRNMCEAHGQALDRGGLLVCFYRFSGKSGEKVEGEIPCNNSVTGRVSYHM